MKTRAILGLACTASLWIAAATQAQDATVVTNLSQISSAVDQSCLIYPFVFPFERTTFQSVDTWFLDFTTLTNAVAAVTNYPSQTQNGVQLWPLRVVQFADTGETVLKPGAIDVDLLQIAAPTNYVPFQHYNVVLEGWCALLPCESYDDLVADGFTNLVPARVVVDVWAVSAQDEQAYFTNGVASEEGDGDSGMLAHVGGFMSMDDDDDGGGDPCSITNLTQPFYITSILQSTNRSTTITWQSCQIFRYLVSYANQLSTNTTWASQSYSYYVWGQTNASSTSWTDTATTNDDGSTVTQRFYRVQRLLGSPIAAGGGHSLAATTNGVLWAWGSDTEGQLGDGGNTNIFSPEEVSNNGCNPESISNVQAVAAGYDYSVAFDADGMVWSWGDGGSGALGNGAYTNVLTPSPINGVSNVVSVAAGYGNTLALRADGTVWAWGIDTFTPEGAGVGGALGAGYTLPLGSTNSPIQSAVPAGTNIVAIADGIGFGLALDKTGRVWGWGNNYYGQIGAGVPTGVTDMDLAQGTNLPVLIPGISNVIAIAAGDAHSIALTSDKRVWTWGSDSSGQLGWNGSPSGPNPTNAPVEGLSNVVAIAGGSGFTLAVTSNGNVYAWGDNSYGELGTNGPSQLTNATEVAGISNAVLVTASFADMYESDFALAVTVNHGTNQYWAWGRDDDGEIGNGTNVAAVYAPAGPLPFTYYNECGPCVQLGTNGSFMATATGTLVLFFNDQHGMFGDNSLAYTATVYGVVSGAIVPADLETGVAVGTVSNGVIYFYTASGICSNCSSSNCAENPSGINTTTGLPVDCSSYPSNNFICADGRCLSLVGKIE
jgi:alpha-tubulin suppressor-like RCC1 family protein